MTTESEAMEVWNAASASSRGLQAMTALHRLIDWLLAPAFRWAGKRWED